MTAIGDHLRLFADETRLRVLHLLEADALTVAELQELLDLGQSSISGHLAKLKHAGLIHDHPEGSSRRYRWRDDVPPHLRQVWDAVRLLNAADDQVKADAANLDRLRKLRGSAWVDRVAGSLHREYAPGRTWECLCQGLLRFARFGRCVDIGAGDGAMVELLAPRSDSLICVDPAPAMAAAARKRIAALGYAEPQVRVIESVGEHLALPDASADSVLFLQSLQYIGDSAAALTEATRILAPGGRLLVLTLLAHSYAESDRYGHRHRGFDKESLAHWTRGLTSHEVELLAPETRAPHFQTILFTASKAGPRIRT